VLFFIILSVQARSIDKIESGTENEMSKEPDDNEKYLKLLTYLNNQETNNHNDDDDVNNDSSSSSTEDVQQFPKRGFFLFPNRRSSSQRYRPIYSYGRKSHWDTFFG